MYRFLMVSILCVVFEFVSAQSKPNIVFFIADDHGRADGSVYGSSEIRTPKMQLLAEEGMVFNNAYVASPACCPSRSALLSGLMPARNGAESNHERPRDETIIMVKSLQEAGYEVAAFGKIAHGRYYDACGFDFYSPNKVGLANDVEAFLKKRSSEKPLCLLVGDRRPHAPWTNEKIYDPEKISLPTRFINTPETRNHWARYLSDVTGMDSEMGKVDELARDYFQTDDYLFLYSSDHGNAWPFGKWNLYEWGISTSLIIRWPGKIDANTKSDAMVSWIDIFPTLIDLVGGEVPEEIDGKSFAPVLKGNTDQHRDLIFATHTGDGEMNLYPIRSVRNKHYKYIRNIYPDCYHTTHSDLQRREGHGAFWDEWEALAINDLNAQTIIKKYHQRPAVEFFDLTTDPTEKINLANNPDYKKQVKKMAKLLDAWMIEQGDSVRMLYDPYPLNEPQPTLENIEKRKQKSTGK
jgi:arylsulfatase A-like enzyme